MKKTKVWKPVLICTLLFGLYRFITVSNSSYSGSFFTGDVAGNMGALTASLLIGALFGLLVGKIYNYFYNL
ncbi:hypothetical protein F9L33_09975 [Amylibacter sp. SFDW26]|uniref:hypothetical protein n=1 Tax=Amylibacter sp. SFDW26 TaxID=2652722 RepID=UPI0012627319|nr:hypothetical protein [Amylibacter sp. SFDW26]KAB7613693.1 hypothetical protein F9L33_09975 [Amylibacter sp. SFDW26]